MNLPRDSFHDRWVRAGRPGNMLAMLALEALEQKRFDITDVTDPNAGLIARAEEGEVTARAFLDSFQPTVRQDSPTGATTNPGLLHGFFAALANEED